VLKETSCNFKKIAISKTKSSKEEVKKEKKQKRFRERSVGFFYF